MSLQDKLFKGHQMSIFNQMLYVNVCSAIVSFSGMLFSCCLLAQHLMEQLGCMVHVVDCQLDASVNK